LSLIVIDYLGLISQETGQGREQRNEQVSALIRECKILAGQLDCAVIAVAQLNRGAATANRPPQMSDLKESGGYEEHSNVVLLLHRAEAIEVGSAEPPDPDLHAFLAKNRNGPVADIKRAWHGRYMTTSGRQEWQGNGSG